MLIIIEIMGIIPKSMNNSRIIENNLNFENEKNNTSKITTLQILPSPNNKSENLKRTINSNQHLSVFRYSILNKIIKNNFMDSIDNKNQNLSDTAINDKSSNMVKSCSIDSQLNLEMDLEPQIKLNQQKAIDLSNQNKFKKKFRNIFKKLYKTNVDNCDYLIKYPLLHSEFKNEKKIQQYYFLIDFSRHFSLSLIVALGFNYPMEILPLMILINSTIFFIIVYYKPFKKKVPFFFGIIFQVGIIMSLSCGLAIAYLDRTKININDRRKIQNYKMNLGWIIVSSNLTILYFLIINNIIKLLKQFIEYIKKLKKKKVSIKPKC